VDYALVSQKHIVLFANWIDRKEGNSQYIKNIPYEFNLILRGSRDGFDPKSFHNKCDNKGANIIVIKIKNSNQIVGGYNPLDWSGMCWKNTPDSFIFSFSNYNKIGTGKISRIINPKIAVASDSRYGPIFGRDNANFNYDLCMRQGGRWSSLPNAYPDAGIPRNYFDIDDYEVFQVKKKFP